MHLYPLWINFPLINVADLLKYPFLFRMPDCACRCIKYVQEPEEGARCLETEVTLEGDLPCGYWELVRPFASRKWY